MEVPSRIQLSVIAETTESVRSILPNKLINNILPNAKPNYFNLDEQQFRETPTRAWIQPVTYSMTHSTEERLHEYNPYPIYNKV